MRRSIMLAAVGLAFLATGLFAQDDVQRGKIKKVDADKGTLTIAVDGQDREYPVVEKTRLVEQGKGEIPDRLKDKRFAAGTPVRFKLGKSDGKEVLLGVMIVRDTQDRPGGRQLRQEKVDTSGMKPLTELGREEYHGYAGGLYPDGRNQRPAAHDEAGLALAKQVRPLDADGKPSPDGKVVLLSVGMSNTTQEFQAFMAAARADREKNPRLALVDGAQGGMTAAIIQHPDQGRGEQYWTTVDQRLKQAGVTRAQVQVAWLKEADARPTDPFPKHAQALHAEMRKIVQLLHTRFPNLKLVYLSSRTCGAFATTPLNPEPFAYETGFAVKWLIEEQIKGDPALNYDPAKGEVRSPWLSWGPYLWTNGVAKRADGVSFEESDFVSSDRTHPSESGRKKVAKLLLDFFKSDPTTRPWFVGS